jgi:hypothetical protein
MKPKTLKVLTILVDLKNAFLKLLEDRYKNPALIMMYAFIDICASLANESKKQNREIFESYLERYLVRSRPPFSIYDLWAARSSIVHSYSPIGRHTKKEKGAKPIFYYSWHEKKQGVETEIVKRGYSDFILLDIEEIKWVAIDCFNNFHKRLEDDAYFEEIVLDNAEHILSDLHDFKFENELALIDEPKDMT